MRSTGGAPVFFVRLALMHVQFRRATRCTGVVPVSRGGQTLPLLDGRVA